MSAKCYVITFKIPVATGSLRWTGWQGKNFCCADSADATGIRQAVSRQAADVLALRRTIHVALE
jgi:hypothetical protein